MNMFYTVCAMAIVLMPLIALTSIGSVYLILRTTPEKFVFTVTSIAQWGALLLTLVIAAGMMLGHTEQIVVHFGSWFQSIDYEFPLIFLIDRLSLPFVLLTCLLTAIVGHFSRRYLHREPGFTRFFVLMLTFFAGMICLAMGGTIDLLFVGWEWVGLSSALLVSFFQHRKMPVMNGLHVFGVYRICDVGLLVGAILLHHYAHTAEFDVAFSHAHWPQGVLHIPQIPLHVMGLFFLLAAIGKSGQVPFGGWVPRAMEGPTPSSAIFYGGISIHAGAYLLLRLAPLLEQSRITITLMIILGSLTALYGTLVGRVQCDAKNQLAYASMAQVGLIFVEIGLGFHFFALLHVTGHATLRTLQFLRSSSVLYDFNRLKAATGTEIARSGLYYELLLPASLRQWLYAWAWRRCDMDAWVMFLFVRPLLRVAVFFETLEQRWSNRWVRSHHEH